MSNRRLIRASEVQSYCYCARSWWLQHVLGLAPQDRGAFTAGTAQHRGHGRRVARSTALGRAAVAILVLALLLGLYALLRLLMGG